MLLFVLLEKPTHFGMLMGMWRWWSAWVRFRRAKKLAGVTWSVERLLSCRPLPLLFLQEPFGRVGEQLHFTSALCCVKSSSHCDSPISFALQVGSASQHAGGCKCSSVFLACTILTFILGRDVVLASATIHRLKAASRNEHRTLRPRVVACYDRRNCRRRLL